MNTNLARSFTNKIKSVFNLCFVCIIAVTMIMPVHVFAQTPPSGPFMYAGDNDGTDGRRYLVIDPTVTDYSKTTNIEEVWETGTFQANVPQGGLAVTPGGGLLKYETPFQPRSIAPIAEGNMHQSTDGRVFTQFQTGIGANNDQFIINDPDLITYGKGGQLINNAFYTPETGMYHVVYRVEDDDKALRIASSSDGSNFNYNATVVDHPIEYYDESAPSRNGGYGPGVSLDTNNLIVRDTTRGNGKNTVTPLVRSWGGTDYTGGSATFFRARRTTNGFVDSVPYGSISSQAAWTGIQGSSVMILDTLNDHVAGNVVGPSGSAAPMNNPYYTNPASLQGVVARNASPDNYMPGMVHYFDNLVGSPSMFRHDHWDANGNWPTNNNSNKSVLANLYPTWAFAESGGNPYYLPNINRSVVETNVADRYGQLPTPNNMIPTGSQSLGNTTAYAGQIYGHDIILNKVDREIYHYVVHNKYHHDIYSFDIAQLQQQADLVAEFGNDFTLLDIINTNQTKLFTLREDGFIGHRAEDQSQPGIWVTHPITVPPAGEANLEISADQNGGSYYVEVFDKNDTTLSNPLAGFTQADYNVGVQPPRAYIDTPVDADGYGDVDDDPVLWNPTDDSLAEFAGQDVVFRFTTLGDATMYAFSFEEGEAKYLESELVLEKEITGRSYEYPNDPPGSGDTITYTITVTNQGNTTVTGINIQDSLGTPSCTPAVSSLDPGEVIECTFMYPISGGDIQNSATIVNTATLNADGISEMTKMVEETLQSTSSLSVVKTTTDNTNFSSPAAISGDVIEYQVEITNDGNTPITNLTIEDTLIDPNALLASCEPFTIAPNGLNPTDSIVCTYQYMLNDTDINNGEVQNVVSVMGESGNNTVSGGDLMDIKLPTGNDNGGGNNSQIKEIITRRSGSRRMIIRTGAGMPALNNVMEEVVPQEVLSITPDWERCDCSHEVTELQKWLNTNGFNLAAEGLGSYGNESECYGHRTEMAVIRFQETYSDWVLAPLSLEEGTGYFGWKTLSIMQAIDRGEIPLRNPLALWQIEGISDRYVIHDAHYIQRTQ